MSAEGFFIDIFIIMGIFEILRKYSKDFYIYSHFNNTKTNNKNTININKCYYSFIIECLLCFEITKITIMKYPQARESDLTAVELDPILYSRRVDRQAKSQAVTVRERERERETVHRCEPLRQRTIILNSTRKPLD